MIWRIAFTVVEEILVALDSANAVNCTAIPEVPLIWLFKVFKSDVNCAVVPNKVTILSELVVTWVLVVLYSLKSTFALKAVAKSVWSVILPDIVPPRSS